MLDKKLSERTMKSKQSYIGKYKHLHAVEVCGVVSPFFFYFSFFDGTNLTVRTYDNRVTPR